MNKDILLGEYMAIAEMLQLGIISRDRSCDAMLEVRNNTLPF